MSFWSIFSTVFITVFLAEIGDKTQLATMLFATKAETNKWAIFLGSAAALVLAAGIGVVVGEQLGKWISPKILKWIAGIGFVAIGLWTILSAD
jgi:putative Ca2+/H+ antiporter (TMEM165/GDT1 family)